jgi:myo-inositol 2-dehydrogenase/D-chiro-inositol 1-dehydrogenase
MIRFAVFGAGRIGAIHAGNIARNDSTRLLYVIDPNGKAAAKLAERYGARVCQTADAFADPDVDAVLIASSTDTHADLAIAAAKAGKAIFCEKPIDLSLERVDATLAAVLPPISYLKVSGGQFRDMTIHDFDMARWLLGEEPTEVFAYGSVLVDPAVGAVGDVDSGVGPARAHQQQPACRLRL